MWRALQRNRAALHTPPANVERTATVIPLRTLPAHMGTFVNAPLPRWRLASAHDTRKRVGEHSVYGSHGCTLTAGTRVHTHTALRPCTCGTMQGEIKVLQEASKDGDSVHVGAKVSVSF